MLSCVVCRVRRRVLAASFGGFEVLAVGVEVLVESFGGFEVRSGCRCRGSG